MLTVDVFPDVLGVRFMLDLGVLIGAVGGFSKNNENL